jgi:uncharacterized ferritin-like protein (DUF455 family)
MDVQLRADWTFLSMERLSQDDWMETAMREIFKFPLMDWRLKNLYTRKALVSKQPSEPR